MNTVVNRMKRTTPKFFKKVRNIGLTLAAVGTAVLAAPVALPAVLLKIAGYFVVAGAVTSAVSQTAVTHEKQ